MKKPSVLIPLSRRVSNAHQVFNAAYFSEQGYAKVLQEDQLTVDSLVKLIQQADSDSHLMQQSMKQLKFLLKLF